MKNIIISDILSILSFLKDGAKEPQSLMMLNDIEHRVNVLNDIDHNELTYYDIILFSVVAVEHEAVLSYFKLNDTHKLKRIYKSIEFYEFTIQPIEKDKRNITVLYTNVGEAGITNMSQVCLRTFELFKCRLAILCGIAAGQKKKVKLYDTVVSTSVVDYEMQRWNSLEEDEFRLEPYMVPQNRQKRTITGFAKQSPLEYVIDPTSVNVDYGKYLVKANLPGKFNVHIGLIASGSKLFADGSRFEIISNRICIKKGVLAVEMEGSGFCPTCIEYEQDWIVIRGISDYGEIDKNNEKNKKMQIVAARHAVHTAFQFIRHYSTLPEFQ